MPVDDISAITSAAVAVQPGAAEQSQAQDKGPGRELTDEEKKEVKELRQRDKEVRAHEMAHVAAGGQYVRGGASFEYQSGPDGKRYAVGGEVSIDTSPVKGDPEKTIEKMRIVRKAALAPADPSAKDRQVAAKASQEMTKAQQELRKQRQEDGGDAAAGEPGKSIASYTQSGAAVHAPSLSDANMLDLIA
ncbi:MAG: hypothetical protein GF418_14960 [Chitinivibrionales bacterium]|nr:hypothetical protein [Chitinivibrionales bacterium]MBD3396920.1 hypothetical protein [Chitinivibrionales bacterium]